MEILPKIQECQNKFLSQKFSSHQVMNIFVVKPCFLVSLSLTWINLLLVGLKFSTYTMGRLKSGARPNSLKILKVHYTNQFVLLETTRSYKHAKCGFSYFFNTTKCDFFASQSLHTCFWEPKVGSQ